MKEYNRSLWQWKIVPFSTFIDTGCPKPEFAEINDLNSYMEHFWSKVDKAKMYLILIYVRKIKFVLAWKIFWLHQVSVGNSLFRILAIWLGKIWVWTPCTYFIFFASEWLSNRHGRIDLFVYQFKLAWRLYLANKARDWVLWYRFPWSKVPFTRVWLLLASIRKSSQILQILSFTVKRPTGSMRKAGAAVEE